MNIYNQFKDSISNILNKKSISVHDKINETADTISKKDIKSLKQAYDAAKSVINPSRYLLVDVYENILTDAHLISVINSRKNKVKSKNFQLVNDKTGKEDLAKTKLLQKLWFEKFVDYTLDANLYGHSLIRLVEVKNGELTDVEVINRKHVKPELNLVVKYPTAIEGVDYTSGEYKSMYIPVCKSAKDLGLLMKVSDLVLFKKMAVSAFAQYTELFGVPLRVGFVGGNNDDSKNNMIGMLSKMGSAAWGIFNENDKVEIHESSGKSGDVFEQFLSYIDASVSKAIVGQTMTTDEGGSYSQANVHQSTFNTLIEADARYVEFVVNGSLIPRLIELGYPLEGYTFKFDNSEYLSIKDKFDMVDKLQKNGLEVDLKFILDEFGIPVTKPEPIAPTAPASDDTGKKPLPL